MIYQIPWICWILLHLGKTPLFGWVVRISGGSGRMIYSEYETVVKFG